MARASSRTSDSRTTQARREQERGIVRRDDARARRELFKKKKDDDEDADDEPPPAKTAKAGSSWLYYGNLKTWTGYQREGPSQDGYSFLYTPLATIRQGTELDVPIPAFNGANYNGNYDRRIGRRLHVTRMKIRTKYLLYDPDGTTGGSMAVRMLVVLDKNAEDPPAQASRLTAIQKCFEVAHLSNNWLLAFRETDNTRRFRILADVHTELQNPTNQVVERSQFLTYEELYLDTDFIVEYDADPSSVTPATNNIWIFWFYDPHASANSQLGIQSNTRIQYHDV